MLVIKIPEIEYFDESNNEFFVIKKMELTLEHSLISISKWESIWLKPFISKDEKTNDEIKSYIKCMTITKNVPDLVYDNLPEKAYLEICRYIDSPMSATTFYDFNENGASSRSNKRITSEYIYYWMAKFNIPFECEKWNLTRLINLLRICAIENNSNKMSKQDTMLANKKLNELRKAKYKTRG